MKSFNIKALGIAASLMIAGSAFAQTCTGIAAPQLGFIRAEGQTELVPAFNVVCTNGTSASAPMTVQLFLSAPGAVSVTSSLLTGSSSNTEIAVQVGNITQTSTAVVSGSSVTISGLSVPVGAVVTFTVSNVRVNASLITTATGGAPSSLTATAFVSGPGTFTPAALASTTLAYVASGFSSKLVNDLTNNIANKINPTQGTAVSPSPVTSIANCSGVNSASTSATATANFFITLTEGFSNAWKTKTEETAPVTTTAVTGTTSGTRFKATFTNIPSGLSIYMPVTVANGNLATAAATTSEVGSFFAPSAVTSPAQFVLVANGGKLVQGATESNGLFQVPVSNGTAVAIYEITGDQQAAQDTLSIPVYLYAASNVGPLQTTALAVAVSFAPITGTTTFPSFVVGSSTSTTGLVSFTNCSTTLLFPFVSNAGGFETGISIANTSLGSSPSAFINSVKNSAQSGTCNLAFYPASSTNSYTPSQAPNGNETSTSPFLTGESYAFTLTQALAVNSANPATFTGFMLAQCNFQYAHGFAYITYGGLGTPNGVAMGYLAEVLSRGTTSAEGYSF